MKKIKTKTKTTKLNGVKVKVTKSNGGSVVEADCNCFGHPFRAHSNLYCPNIKK